MFIGLWNSIETVLRKEKAFSIQRLPLQVLSYYVQQTCLHAVKDALIMPSTCAWLPLPVAAQPTERTQLLVQTFRLGPRPLAIVDHSSIRREVTALLVPAASSVNTSTEVDHFYAPTPLSLGLRRPRERQSARSIAFFKTPRKHAAGSAGSVPHLDDKHTRL